MEIDFDNEYSNSRVSLSSNRLLQLVGQLKHTSRIQRAELVAANPIMRGYSYSGSGLPFPNPVVAFEGTPNWFSIDVNSGRFVATFSYPNSYYTMDATKRIPPSLFLVVQVKDRAEPLQLRMELPDELQLKTLTHRAERTGPEFYARRELIGVRSQEEIFRMLGDQKVKLLTA